MSYLVPFQFFMRIDRSRGASGLAHQFNLCFRACMHRKTCLRCVWLLQESKDLPMLPDGLDGSGYCVCRHGNSRMPGMLVRLTRTTAGVRKGMRIGGTVPSASTAQDAAVGDYRIQVSGRGMLIGVRTSQDFLCEAKTRSLDNLYSNLLLPMRSNYLCLTINV
ncbi:uncharacterized protein EI90DRAFT_3036166 [Cantharellus anzutake]|uniref:uncharacterized protein n=1 Tax=Cantharellus anzutake TaxID=1750568 RepID=UPI00190441D4|nr:uncharacterized protein EI90DRAFT_3036166 [Cantharellus anzutake]KAF8340610.1 hypothetical protein EI90DRAFT_3036166 [Cantharellus anzutake]